MTRSGVNPLRDAHGGSLARANAEEHEDCASIPLGKPRPVAEAGREIERARGGASNLTREEDMLYGLGPGVEVMDRSRYVLSLAAIEGSTLMDTCRFMLIVCRTIPVYGGLHGDLR